MNVTFLNEASYDMYQTTNWELVEDTLTKYLQKKVRDHRVDVLTQKNSVQISIDKHIIGSISVDKEHRAFVARLADTNQGAKGFTDLIRTVDYLLDLSDKNAPAESEA